MAWASLGLGFAGSNQKGLLRMTQQMRLLLGLQQDILWPGTHVGWLATLMYSTVSTSDWLLEPQFPPKDAQPNLVLLVVSRRIRLGPPSSASSIQSSAPSAHNSHAADGPLGNRQSSGSYGSFKPPFLPNNPSSGAVLIPSCRQLLGMPRPSLGWIYRCAVIFTQQLPALIPRLPDLRPATGATCLLTTYRRPDQPVRESVDL